VNNKAHAVFCSLHEWAEQRVVVWVCDRCSNQLLCSSWNQCGPGLIITHSDDRHGYKIVDSNRPLHRRIKKSTMASCSVCARVVMAHQQAPEWDGCNCWTKHSSLRRQQHAVNSSQQWQHAVWGAGQLITTLCFSRRSTRHTILVCDELTMWRVDWHPMQTWL